MMPTSRLPSGVMASPSMPLLATRPDVLPLISSAPTGLSRLTANFAGSVNARTRRPLSVFVGDEHAPTVAGHTNALRIEPRVGRIRRAPGGIEVVRSTREVVRMVDGIQRRRPATQADPGAGSVNQRRLAGQQRGLDKHRRQSERKRRASVTRRQTEV